MEPDNAFFDLMLVYLLFCLRRDNEALAALHRAAHQPRYDDHIGDDLRHRIGRDASVETKLAEWAATLFPHLAKYREIARLATWHAAKAEERSNHAQALRIYEDVMRVGGLIRDSEFVMITVVLGISIQSISWSGKTRRLNENEKERLAAVKHPAFDPQSCPEIVLARRFAQYARAHSRPDLAVVAVKEAHANLQLKRQCRKWVESYPPETRFKTLFASRWAERALIGQGALNLLLWLLLAVMLRLSLRSANPHFPPTDKQRAREEVSAVDVVSVVLLACWLTLALVVVGILKGFGWREWWAVSPEEIIDEIEWQSTLYTALVVSAPAPLTAVICAYSTTWRYRKQLFEPFTFRFPSLSSLLPFSVPPTTHPSSLTSHPSYRVFSIHRVMKLLTLALELMLTVFSIGAWLMALSEKWWIPTALVLSLIWFVRWMVKLARGGTNLFSLWSSLLSLVLTLGTIGMWVAVLIGLAGWDWLLAALGLSALCWVRWVVKWLWVAPETARPFLRIGFAWYRRTLATFLVLVGFAYLLVVTAVLPVRRAEDARMNQLVQHGELYLARQMPVR